MPINFDDESNKLSYTGRAADESWNRAILDVCDAKGLRIVDVGCGGGIYSKAWIALGAREVIGIDRSENMISAAKETCRGRGSVSFRFGDATDTGLSDSSVDIVFQRALIHHLTDIDACLAETIRILKPGGKIVIQDRTPKDISCPASTEHIRGYFFSCFPQLLKIEAGRRKTEEAVLTKLRVLGFEHAKSMAVWETRRIYATKEELFEEIRQRKGRSILHELNDSEIEVLVSYMGERLQDGVIKEKDRWTIWDAIKPS